MWSSRSSRKVLWEIKKNNAMVNNFLFFSSNLEMDKLTGRNQNGGDGPH